MAASWNTGDGLFSIDTDVQLATPWDAETLRGARDPARCRRARGRRDATFRAGTSSRGVETAANIRDAVRGSDGMCAGCRLGCRFVSLVRFWLPIERCRAFGSSECKTRLLGVTKNALERAAVRNDSQFSKIRDRSSVKESN